MSSDRNSIYKRRAEIAWRNIADESVLVPISRTAADVNSVVVLNETAGRIWNLLDGEHTAAQIIEVIVSEYQVSSEEASRELQALLSRLTDGGLVEKVVN